MVHTADIDTMKETDPHQEKFARFETEGKQPSWLYPLRKAGMARFAELGFPTVQDEDWRFTNVAPLAKLPFKPVFELRPDGLKPGALKDLIFSSLPGTRLVFLDGHFTPAFSSPRLDQGGIIVTNLAAALQEHPSILEQHLGRYARSETDPFTALNTAFFQDGGFVYLEQGKALDNPVQLLFLSTAKEPGAAANPRNLIIAGQHSRATVLETFLSTVDASAFTNPVTEIVAQDGAWLEHVKFQDEAAHAYHLAGLYAQLERHTNVIMHSIAAGARLSRNSIHTRLMGEGLECVLNGLYLTRGEQLADHHMVVEHVAPHCASHEYFNGILDGRSKGVFHGRILVRQQAQKTDAKQTNRNLLLSDEATADTKPQLEIYADDVKCTHGATVGQLNDESIFYLRSRGIGKRTARRMLIHAFAGEIIERIRNRPVREELDRLVWDRLEANPHIET
jgi:Fe-S cluster assembly protein SufD